MSQYLSVDEYKGTVSEARLHSVRNLAAEAAARLTAARLPTDTVIETRVIQRPVLIPRNILGVRVGDRQEMRPHNEDVLAGWRLRSYGKIMGDDGSEWYQWTDICILAENGLLYTGQHQREERRHGQGVSVTDKISASPLAASHQVFNLERSTTDGSPHVAGGFCDSIVESINDLLKKIP